jgi:putative ABC transport system permease protein
MLLDLAFKTIWRRRLRAALTVLGVAAAIQLYLMMNSILAFYDSDIQGQVAAFAGKVYVQRPMQATSMGEDFPSMNSSISTDTALTILAMEGINRAESSAMLFIPLLADMRPNLPPAYFIVGMEAGHETAYLGGLEVVSGTAGLDGPRGVILGSRAATHYRPTPESESAQPGDTITVLDEEFTVLGILPSASTIINGAVIMPLATAQDLFNHPRTVSAVILTPERVEDMDGIRRAVADADPNLRASDQADIADNARDMMNMQRMFFRMINYSTILSTIMVVMVVVLVVVMEQRKEIGTLRAMGARRSLIFGMVLGEALLLTLCGGLFAIPLSIAMDKLINYGMFWSWTETLHIWLSTLGMCLVIGVLASLLPSWQAMRVDPLTAMRMD